MGAGRNNPLRLIAVATLIGVTGCSRALLSSGLDAPEAAELVSKPGFTWTSDSAGRVRVYVENGITRPVNALSLAQALASVESTFAITPVQRPLSIFVVPSTDRMNALLARKVDGRSFHQTGVAAVVAGENWEAIARHEMTHVVLGQQWGKASGQWISEGAATWAGNPYHGRDIRILARDRLLLPGRLLPLAKLEDEFGNAPDEVTYLQSAAVAQFLATRFGVPALKSVWQEGMQAVPRATGLGFDEFEREWRSYLGS